jgi:hypothetical protein
VIVIDMVYGCLASLFDLPCKQDNNPNPTRL